MSKLKVLFITRKWPPALGGMETYSQELTKVLSNRVDLTIKALPGQANGKPPTSLALLLFYIKTGVFLLKSSRHYDIIHFGDLVLFPLAWLDARLSKKHARIITVHGLDIIYGNREGLAPAAYRLFIYLASKCRRDIDAFISNSQNTANLAEEKNFSPVYPIPLGVSMRHYKESPNPTPDRYLFFFGRIVKRKGLFWFMDNVMPQLPKDVVVLAAGKIWDHNEVNSLSEDRFHHLGIVSDEELTYYCRNAIAVIVPNIRNQEKTDVEGFGLVTVDAGARGGIVLASALEGITDAVKDGQTGFLLSPEQPEIWADKINEILEWDSKQRKTFQTRSLECLNEFYTWSRVADDTMAVYKNHFKS